MLFRKKIKNKTHTAHKKNKSFVRGFTLIELLMVISIIGLITSVVLVSLQDARNKAKDATIKSQMAQIVNLMNLEYNENGSYCKLMPGGGPNGGAVNLSTDFTSITPPSNYASKMNEIIKVIYDNSALDTFTNQKMYGLLNVPSIPAPACKQVWSYAAYLNSNNKWYCIGSSGKKGEYAVLTTTVPAPNPGCYRDP